MMILRRCWAPAKELANSGKISRRQQLPCFNVALGSRRTQNVSFRANCINRGLFTVSEITPKVEGESTSEAGVKNCGWLNRLKNSARNSRSVRSRNPSGKCLNTEKSVFTKRGPYSGARFALPSVPGCASTKQLVSKNFCTVGLLNLPLQIWSGRVTFVPLFEKFTPEVLLLATMKIGNPEEALSITLICQSPAIAFRGPFQLLPNCLFRPKGRS